MKKILFSAALMGAAFAYAQNTGIGTTAPGATLEVQGSPDVATSPDGVIAPRLTREQLSAKTAYGAAQTGAIVYITDIAGATNTQTARVAAPGYYYFDGALWQKISGADWSLAGNAGTVPGTDFIGTTDAQPLEFRTGGRRVGILGVKDTDNMGFGANAMNAAATGTVNVGFGGGVFKNLTTGSYNVGVGQGTLSSLSTGTANVALGNAALATNSTGSYNVGLGNNALSHLSNGSGNVALGNQALMYGQKMENNIAIGENALIAPADGSSYNISIGLNTMQYMKGSGNLAIGTGALYYAGAVSGNIAIGDYAGRNIDSSQNNNVLIGAGAGSNVSGSGNVVLGSDTANGLSGNNNILLSGNGLNATAVFHADAQGHVAVGPSARVVGSNSLTVVGSAGAPVRMVWDGQIADSDFTLITASDLSLPEPSQANAGRIYNIIADRDTSFQPIYITGLIRQQGVSASGFIEVKKSTTVQCYYDGGNVEAAGWLVISSQ